MLAPVNGSDWQFITADSHTAQRGLGGHVPLAAPWRKPSPSSLPRYPHPGKRLRVRGASKRVGGWGIQTVRAWLAVSVAETKMTGCHSHSLGVGWATVAVALRWGGRSGLDLGRGGRWRASGALSPAGTPLWLRGGLGCLRLQRNPPASAAARGKVGVRCPPSPLCQLSGGCCAWRGAMAAERWAGDPEAGGD